MKVAPEYWFWAQKAFGDITALNKNQVTNVLSTGYSWFGLVNSYNAKMFSSIAFTPVADWNATQTAYLSGMMAQYEMTQTQILGMYDVLTYMVQDYLFLGTTGTFPVSSIIQGWYSEMSLRVSDYTNAAFLKGDAIYLEPWVTPVLTN